MRLLVKKIYGFLSLIKNVSVSFFYRKQHFLYEEMEDFIKESLTSQEVLARLNYVITSRKLNRFDVYDLIKVAKNLSNDIPQDQTLYTAVAKTADLSLDSMINSIFYYSGLISDFKTVGLTTANSKIAEFTRESSARKKLLKESIAENDKQIKILQESNKSLQSDLLALSFRDGEYILNMTKLCGVIDTISTKKLNELKEEKKKCLKYLG